MRKVHSSDTFTDALDAAVKNYAQGILYQGTLLIYNPSKISQAEKLQIVKLFRSGLIWFISRWKKGIFVYFRLDTSDFSLVKAHNPHFKISVKAKISGLRVLMSKQNKLLRDRSYGKA